MDFLGTVRSTDPTARPLPKKKRIQQPKSTATSPGHLSTKPRNPANRLRPGACTYVSRCQRHLIRPTRNRRSTSLLSLWKFRAATSALVFFLLPTFERTAEKKEAEQPTRDQEDQGDR